jgi:DNA repair protein RecO (recombination protein O)
MDSFTTDAINLKSYPLSDFDKIVVMYSKDKGLIRGVAKGVKKTKSKLGARMELFVANKLMLSKGKNLDTICQAVALNTFNKTRCDMDKIFYSMYISEVVNNFGVENDPASGETYKILYKALEAISDAKNKIEIVISALKFQLKFMKISGFGAELSNCLICGKPVVDKSMYFVHNKGGIVCEDCCQNAAGQVHMHYKIRDFLMKLEQTEFDEKSDYEEKATEKIVLTCFKLLQDYINLHSPRKFKTVDILQETACIL